MRSKREAAEASHQGRNSLETLKEVDLQPPKGISAEAAAFWDEHARDLIAEGLLDYLSYSGFLMVCQAWGDYCEAEAIIKAEGLIVQSKAGSKKNPAVAIRNQALVTFTKLAGKFSLVPN